MLKVSNLSKEYENFTLNDVSFELPEGYIMGFIGMNGAGKTTTLKCILNLIKPTRGEVEILGRRMDTDEEYIKNEIGFMLGGADYYTRTKVCKLTSVYKRFFVNWDDKVYRGYIDQFKIDESKTVSQLSTGMKVKLAITYALSHKAQLLIFDEPTSGLDPVARDEIKDIFKSIVANGDKSIIFSTHITSDLDKCADYIIFIRNGKLIANAPKDEIIDSHALVCGKKAELNDGLKARLVGYKENAFGYMGLIKRKDILDSDVFETSVPNLEDVMIYYDTEAAK